MEKIYADGRARAIGLSNFQPHHIRKIHAETDVPPAVNQIELHPFLTQDELRAFDAEHQIATEAWSPIAQGGVLDDPTIESIAEAHGKTPAQIVLRWHIELGNIVFPKSVTPARIKENFEIFDFELSAEEIGLISGAQQERAHRTRTRTSSTTSRADQLRLRTNTGPGSSAGAGVGRLILRPGPFLRSARRSCRMRTLPGTATSSDADHRGQQDGQRERESAMPAEEVDRYRVRILRDEDDQQDQEDRCDDEPDPHSAGASVLDVTRRSKPGAGPVGSLVNRR